MSWSRVDVYEFIRRHDKLNFGHEYEINESNEKNNYFDSSREYGEVEELQEKGNMPEEFVLEEFEEFRECDKCIEFCEKRRDDIDAIRDISKALIIIHEALEDIEINRICEGIRDIEEGIRHTQEGVDEIKRILCNIFG